MSRFLFLLFLLFIHFIKVFLFLFRPAAGYVEQYKDIRRKREIWKMNDYTYKDFKQFKDNAGFGYDFLDPMGTREPTEQKVFAINLNILIDFMFGL